jgi:hypothetical protein
MFKDTRAFRGFSVNDIQKAKEFYGKTRAWLGPRLSLEKPRD